MSRRLNWEPLRLSHKRKLNIKDEQERLDSGYTARWLEEAEEREVRTASGNAFPCACGGKRSFAFVRVKLHVYNKRNALRSRL